MSATALGTAAPKPRARAPRRVETRCLVRAVVIGYIAAEAIPVGFITPTAITGSMPPGLANHVATVALFGKPSNGCLKLDRRTTSR